MRHIAVITALAISLSLVSVFPALAQMNQDYTKAIWVWDFYEAASNPDKITELLQFLKEHDINLLFIGTRRTLPDQPETYEELIRRAHEQGIRVFALVGRAQWALEPYHREAVEELRQVLAYNERYPWAKFDGIQYDIEPHTLPEFKTKRGSVSYQYIQILRRIAREIAASGETLEFNAAIPCWYATGEGRVIVETGGERKPLSYFVLDIVDSVSIMAYRDTAERQIRDSQAELDYAASIGKKVYIAAETNPSNGRSIPMEITYFHRGMEYMKQQLHAVAYYLANHPGFAGIAIHSYPSFKQMMKNQYQDSY